MRRVITEKVENLLAKKMLEGTIQEGQNMAININDIN
jgi:ATP-dependent Clp protease ATP-binding subunit ClpA